jgi:hypothetical protein
VARPGLVWLGMVRRGMVRLGMARQAKGPYGQSNPLTEAEIAMAKNTKYICEVVVELDGPAFKKDLKAFVLSQLLHSPWKIGIGNPSNRRKVNTIRVRSIDFD